MRVKMKTGASLVRWGKDYSGYLTPGRDYLVLAEVREYHCGWLRFLCKPRRYYEIMDDLRGDPTDPNAAPYRFPAKWFEIVDDDCSAWVSQFYYFSAEKISGKPAYVRSYRAHDFYERMHTGELSYLAILRLTYPPSTWHYDRTGIDDSIERWMSEFTEE